MSKNLSNFRTPGDFAKRVADLAIHGSDIVPELADLILDAALALSASDIHIDPGENEVNIRLRLDGVMQDYGSFPKELSANLAARYKVLAGLLSYRTDIPQEGGISRRGPERDIELRIATFPTIGGERVAIRVFDSQKKCSGIDDLGLPKRQTAILAEAIAKPEGLILLAGPCGSGKTTSLYAALNQICERTSGQRSIVTVEDPVERRLGGVIQTQVNNAVGLNFARSLRSLLRQDPEVIMVGEIRDVETSGIVVEAALSGHLVLSTIHAARVVAIPHRLLDMGVEAYALAGAFSLAMAQRLVRVLCSKCKVPEKNMDGDGVPRKCQVCFEAAGCVECHGTGYLGRRIIAETLAASPELHDAIMERAPRLRFEEIAAASAGQLDEAALELIKTGVTSVGELRRVLDLREGNYNSIISKVE